MWHAHADAEPHAAALPEAEAVPDSEEEREAQANPCADPEAATGAAAALASKEAVMQLVGGVSHPC